MLSSENVSGNPDHWFLSTLEITSGQKRLQLNNQRITAPEALAGQRLAREGQPYLHHDAEASHICSHKHSLKVQLEAPSPQSPATIPAAQQAESNISAAALAAAGATLQPMKCSARMVDRSTAAVHIEAQYALPPLLLFDLLADPTQHAAIFNSIEAADAELLSASGNQKLWRLDYRARWRFWKWSGVCENKMHFWTDQDSGTIVFKLREPGFLRHCEGKWTIQALESSSSSSSNIATANGGQSELTWHATSNSSNNSSRGLGKYTAAAAMLPLTLPFAFVRPTATSSSSSNSSQQRSTNSSHMWHASLWDYVQSLTVTQPIHNKQENDSSSSGSSSSKMSSNDAVAIAAGSNAASNRQLSNAGSGASWFSSVHGDSARQRGPLKNRPPAAAAAAAAAVITVKSTTGVKLAPPPPLNKILKGQTQGMVEDMLHGLVHAAAARQQQQQQQR